MIRHKFLFFCLHKLLQSQTYKRTKREYGFVCAYPINTVVQRRTNREMNYCEKGNIKTGVKTMIKRSHDRSSGKLKRNFVIRTMLFVCLNHETVVVDR